MQHPPQNSLTLRRRRRQHGQSLIEFALIVPMLMLMLVSVVYIAQGFNLQMVLYGAAYEGAKSWAKNPAGGSANLCTPPACDPAGDGAASNFDGYLAPVVRRYVTNNGFDGNKVLFFAKEADKAQELSEFYSRQKDFVRVTVLYPFALPIGNFAQKYQEVLISASCTMKRGS